MAATAEYSKPAKRTIKGKILFSGNIICSECLNYSVCLPTSDPQPIHQSLARPLLDLILLVFWPGLDCLKLDCRVSRYRFLLIFRTGASVLYLPLCGISMAVRRTTWEMIFFISQITHHLGKGDQLTENKPDIDHFKVGR